MLLILYSLLLASTNIHADIGSADCAISAQRFTMGGLPTFTENTDYFYGYSCLLAPKYSHFRGNWFPSIPKISVSRATRAAETLNGQSSPDDLHQSWQAELAIKRIGRSQLVIQGGHRKETQIITAKDDVAFYADTASTSQDVQIIQKGQRSKLEYTENTVGLALLFPFQIKQALTELYLRKTEIHQPVQANLLNLPKQSLFNSRINLIEFGAQNWSNHRGLNLNWQVSIASGNIKFKNKVTDLSNEKNKNIASVRASLELNYVHKVSQKWFVYSGMKGDVRSWVQEKGNNPDFRIAQSHAYKHKIHFGLGARF